MRNTKDFTVRAVEEIEGKLYGVVRMGARQGPATWIYGISARFLTDPQKEQYRCLDAYWRQRAHSPGYRGSGEY